MAYETKHSLLIISYKSSVYSVGRSANEVNVAFVAKGIWTGVPSHSNCASLQLLGEFGLQNKQLIDLVAGMVSSPYWYRAKNNIGSVSYCCQAIVKTGIK